MGCSKSKTKKAIDVVKDIQQHMDTFNTILNVIQEKMENVHKALAIPPPEALDNKKTKLPVISEEELAKMSNDIVNFRQSLVGRLDSLSDRMARVSMIMKPHSFSTKI